MSVIHLFEDAGVERLYPITLTRTAACIALGSYSLLELAQHANLLGKTSPVIFCREFLASTVGRLAPVQSADAATINHWSQQDILWLNASLWPDTRIVAWIKKRLEAREGFRIRQEGRILASFVPKGTKYDYSTSGDTSITSILANLNLTEMPQGDLKLLEEIYHLVAAQKELCLPNLEYRLRQGAYQQLSGERKGVWVAEGVDLPNLLAFKTADGPVILDHKVSVLDFAFFRGPVYLGPGTKVIEHAAVKDGVSTGRTCKIGGEIECAVMDSYSNKQHHGFLGHAFIGSWVNMGAGTSNSDLKNTYGSVQISRNGERINTGLQFFGCVMGDYSKTAINTSIFTGKIVGVNSMLYGFVGQNVPSFTNYANSFGQITSVDLDQAIRTQGRMFARRGIEQHDADIRLLRHAYQLTLDERRLSSEALVL